MITLSAAARELGLQRSTVLRYIRRHPELNHAEADQPPRVDLEELREHRARTRRFTIDAVPDKAQADHKPSAAEGSGGAPAASTDPLYTARLQRERAQAAKAMMETQRMARRLVPIDEVQEESANMAVWARQDLDRMARDLAEQIAIKAGLDRDEILALLREGIDRFCTEFAARLRHSVNDVKSGERSEAD